MKIPHRQTTLSGCAYFCLSNLFDDARFTHDVETLTRGQGSFVTNERLREFYPQMYIETQFCLPKKLKDFPDRLTDDGFFNINWSKTTELSKEFLATPYLITIDRPDPLPPHAILAMHNWKDNWMYVFDSMVENRTYCDLEAFVAGYSIQQVESFHSLELEPEIRDYPCAIDKRQFRHLFMEGE